MSFWLKIGSFLVGQRIKRLWTPWIGRFTTVEEIDYVVLTLKDRVAKLRDLSPLWDMHKEGIDISTIQWAAH